METLKIPTEEVADSAQQESSLWVKSDGKPIKGNARMKITKALLRIKYGCVANIFSALETNEGKRFVCQIDHDITKDEDLLSMVNVKLNKFQ